MLSKYVVFAILALLALSSSPVFAAPAVLPASLVDTHGPRTGQVTFSVIATDSSLKSSLLAGSIQAPEWTFTVSSWRSIPTGCTPTTGSCKKGTQLGYTFDGVGFNTLRPYMNNVHFRRAMEYLTNYGFIQGTVLSGVGGSASPFVLPCRAYPGACFGSASQAHVTYAFHYSTLKAANELLKAGLIAAISGTLVCSNFSAPAAGCQSASYTITSVQLPTITAWYRHQNPAGSGTTTGNGQNGDCTTKPSGWSGNHKLACLFQPAFYYRSDDPLRSGVALALSSAAATIGFSFNMIGIFGGAGGKIYGPSAGAVISDGSYNAACSFSDARGAETGCNNAPSWDNTAVNATDPSSVTDKWDMYTFGWIASSAYVFQGEIFNSIFGSSTVNFLNYYNKTVDHDSDSLLYASHTVKVVGDNCNAVPGGATSCSARAAAILVGKDAANQIPYLMSFFQSNLWAVNTNNWAGFANIPSVGPTTVGGVYYTLLNAHALSGPGNFQYALHQAADTGGMDPMYNTNWVWQADIWGSIYDAPLATPPTKFNVANFFMDYMTTKHSAVPFSGAVGGAGWGFPQGTPIASISGGENISFTFRNNITWYDGFPLTAADYNYSIYAWNLAGNPNTPDLLTPLSFIMSGSAGLLAIHVVGNRIDMFTGSNSVWNTANLDIPVLPQHIFQYFNIDLVATGDGAVDTTLPYATAIGTCPSGPCTAGTAPSWLQYEPNLEVGSGPFWLQTFNSVSGAGVLVANPTYMRTAWLVNATANHAGAAATQVTIGGIGNGTALVHLSTIQQYLYNAGTTALVLGCGVGNSCYYQITNATASYQLFKVVGKVSTPVAGVTVTGNFCNGSGVCEATLHFPALANGKYEIVMTASYNLLGAPRTWYQFTGFIVP